MNMPLYVVLNYTKAFGYVSSNDIYVANGFVYIDTNASMSINETESKVIPVSVHNSNIWIREDQEVSNIPSDNWLSNEDYLELAQYLTIVNRPVIYRANVSEKQMV